MIINTIPYTAAMSRYTEDEVNECLLRAREVSKRHEEALLALSKAAVWNPLTENPTQHQKDLYAYMVDLPQLVIECSIRHSSDAFPVKKWYGIIAKAERQTKAINKKLKQ